MRLIDADQLLQKLQKDPLFPLVEQYGISRVIEAAPTVVPCCFRQCENDGYHTNCKIMQFCVEAEDYCSRGERREDEAN